MKILITGGTGFLGRLIAERCVARGDAVSLFDIAVPEQGLGTLDGKVDIVCGDITDIATVQRVIKGCDAVVHLASMVSAGSEADFDAAMRVNLDGGRVVPKRLARTARQRRCCSPQVWQFLVGRRCRRGLMR